MKKIIICIILISGVTLFHLAVNGNDAHSNATGAPSGKTGSPGDGSNCSGCHTGSAVVTNQTLITSDIPVDGYVPGTTYNITATISKTGINKFGFQVSPQNTSGQLKGALINVTPTLTQLISSGKYITHKSAGTAGTANSNTWNFQWTAPAAGTGTLKFYGAFVAANSSNTSSGDQVFLSNLSVQENTSIGIQEQAIATNRKVFPMPCTNTLYIETADHETGEIHLQILSTKGDIIQRSDCVVNPLKKNIEIQTIDLEQGTYIIIAKGKNGEILFHQKFIKA